MKEQDAAHSFEESDDFKIRNYGAIQNKLLSANAELTSLRSELQQERDKVRNQAIQDCIEKVNDFKSISDPVITFVFTTITKALEQLKINHESSTTKRTN